MINLKTKPIDLFNLALLGMDNKNRFERIAKGNRKITTACTAMLKVANVICKNINNKKSDLYVSIRSPSQWQLSGSCLPLLRPVVYISANAPSWYTNQSQVRWKIKDFLPQLSNHQQDIIWLGAH